MARNTKLKGQYATQYEAPLEDCIGASSEPQFDPMADLSVIKVFHTQSDKSLQCPHCYHHDEGHEHLGVMSVNGINRDLYNCSSCNQVFDGVPNSIKAYLDQAKGYVGTDNVSFIRAKRDSHSSIINTSRMESLLDSLKDTVERSIEDLQTTVTRQQAEIQELKSDPVRGLREIVNEFNLK